MNDILQNINDRAFSDTATPGGKVKTDTYARVSTDKLEQKESCKHQIEDAQAFASQHPNINFVNFLVDDGISGKNAVNRPAFNELIADIESGTIEMVIVRSLSRMQRDVETFMCIYNLCANNDVLLYILDKNIIVDPDDKMQYFMLLMEAWQDEKYSADQSKHGHKTHQRRIDNKELSSKDVCLGYDWHPKSKELGTLAYISINEEEAEVIRYIFERYTYEQADPADIANELNLQGVTNRYSKAKHFTAGTINGIVQNTKYIGKFYINTRTTVNKRGQKGGSKRICLPKEEWVLIDRPDLRIVDQDLYDVAQRLRASRQKLYFTRDKATVRKGFEGTHDFANKVKCACCGQYYRFDYSDRKRTIPIYRIGNHKDCPNAVSRVKEDDVRAIAETAIRKLMADQEETIKRIEDILCEGMEQFNSKEGEIKKITKAIASLSKEIDKLSNVLTNERIIANDELFNRYLDKIEQAQKSLVELEQRKAALTLETDRLEVTEKIKHLRAAIAEFTEVKELSRERILRNIKEILVDTEGGIKLVLASGLSYAGKYQFPYDRYSYIATCQSPPPL